MNIVQKELDEKRIEFAKRMKDCRGKQEELKLKVIIIIKKKKKNKIKKKKKR